MKLDWAHVGLTRQVGTALSPPNSHHIASAFLGEGSYLLAYDETLQRTVYVYSPRHEEFGAWFSFDGERWIEGSDKTITWAGNEMVGLVEQPFQGFYDSSRKGIAAWTFETHFRSSRPLGVLIRPEGPTPIVGSGDGPLAPPKGRGELLRGLFAYDPVRRFTVCLTHKGISELDADGVWRGCAAAEGVIAAGEWGHANWGGAFDAPRNRVVFWLHPADEETFWFFSWDGRALVRLVAAPVGPDTLRRQRGGPPICAHPVHGIVMYGGPTLGLLALEDSGWKELPSASAMPPETSRARMCFDTSLSALILGPGDYLESDDQRFEQNVFFVQRGGAWVKRNGQLTEDEHSMYPRGLDGRRGRAWLRVSTGDLKTLAWSNEGWTRLFNGGDEGKKLLPWEQGAHLLALCVVKDERAWAIGPRGEIFEWGGHRWETVQGVAPVFKLRQGAVVVYEPTKDRLVVWGGKVNNRRSNQTIFYEKGAWRVAKKSSPDAEDRDVTVEYQAVFDGALQRVVRFGATSIATLEGDIWQAHPTPAGYPMKRGYVSQGGDWVATGPNGRAWNYIPLYDPKTSKTLLVNLETRTVSRFDLAHFEADVAEFEHPARSMEKGDGEHWLVLGPHCFDPATRLLHVQDPKDTWGRFALDLGPAFDAA